jgi:large subunit ribosomal protein L31/Ran GTPase-activating protein 1
MTVAPEWSLSEEQRADTVSRIRANISSMAFFAGAPLPPDAVAAAATAAERKAYTVARVEARTTTGERPHHETLKAYVRKLSALVLEAAAGGGLAAAPAATAAGAGAIDLTGDREFLTRESAQELLAPMLAPGAAITRIRFSTKSFGVDAAEVAAAAIRNVAHTLVDADMSDVIAGRPEAEALGALRILSDALKTARLRRLNLSDNALGEKGIRACAAAFAHQEALESIAFQNVGCSVHGCAALEELLRATTHLRRLHLYNNMSGDEGAASVARLLARCPAMEDFRMVSSRVGAAGGAALAAALASAGASLVRLDLHDNPMTEEVAGGLAAVLRAHPGLKALNLNDTCLGDAGVAGVVAALPAGVKGLEELELALNEVTAEGAAAVAAALAGKSALAVLNLRENELEDGGALALAQVSRTQGGRPGREVARWRAS